MSKARRLKLLCAWLPFSPSVDVRIVIAADDADTATSGKWARTNRPVRASPGVYTGWKCDKVREEGDATGEGGDSRPDLKGAGRGRRRVPRADRAAHRRELQVHCYRMLGSFQDAEDAVQDTLLIAWQGLGGFEGRASLRTWLYRIATNRCLNALRSASRRPAKKWDIPEVDRPSRLGSAKSCGSSPIPTPSSRVRPICRSALRHATNRAKPSPWPS